MRVRRAAVPATAAALLLTAGCGGSSITSTQARTGVRSGLGDLAEALTNDQQPADAVRTASSRTGCGDEDRWQGVVTFSLPVGTGLANAAVQADARLEGAGWHTAAAIGSTADGVILLPVRAGSTNAGRVEGEVTITGSGETLRYVATLRSGCFG